MKNLPPKTSRVGEPNNPWRTLAAATNPTNHIARSGTAEQRTSLLRPAQPNYNSTQASGWMFSAKRRSFIVFTSSSPIASHPLIKATTQQNKCLPWQSVSTRLLVRRLNQVGYIYSYLNTTNFSRILQCYKYAKTRTTLYCLLLIMLTCTHLDIRGWCILLRWVQVTRSHCCASTLPTGQSNDRRG